MHTFDFPILNRAGPRRQIMMVAALAAAGLGLSVSGMVLGKRRMARALKAGRKDVR